MHPYSLFLETVALRNENAELKNQIETMKLQKITAVVADLIGDWLDKPLVDKDERQDIEEFADELTRYIKSQLK
ncbi:hypothetical protein [Lysinibacillus piscis]|uniref:Uncharacterized protein n=1 Tax=Lysinibacillus piscis TaxID=2518931 RepID=A0ABQ5NM79_9BACI|nr:hypothetical protein [Lysinibacillus sp. KH24]GLC89360.1 hypothetical protein LYSBPC_24870 [Lysinibacillus sp. KH24]